MELDQLLHAFHWSSLVPCICSVLERNITNSTKNDEIHQPNVQKTKQYHFAVLHITCSDLRPGSPTTTTTGWPFCLLDVNCSFFHRSPSPNRTLQAMHSSDQTRYKNRFHYIEIREMINNQLVMLILLGRYGK